MNALDDLYAYDKAKFVQDFGEVLGNFLKKGETRVRYRTTIHATTPYISDSEWLIIQHTLILLQQYQTTLGIRIGIFNREAIALEMALGAGLCDVQSRDLDRLRAMVVSH